MAGQGALHLGRPHPVAADVDDVIHPPRDPVVAVSIAAAAVTREVVTLDTPGVAQEGAQSMGQVEGTPGSCGEAYMQQGMCAVGLKG